MTDTDPQARDVIARRLPNAPDTVDAILSDLHAAGLQITRRGAVTSTDVVFSCAMSVSSTIRGYAASLIEMADRMQREIVQPILDVEAIAAADPEEETT